MLRRYIWKHREPSRKAREARWETYWIMLMYVSTFIMSPSLQSFLKPSTRVLGLRRPSPVA